MAGLTVSPFVRSTSRSTFTECFHHLSCPHVRLYCHQYHHRSHHHRSSNISPISTHTSRISSRRSVYTWRELPSTKPSDLPPAGTFAPSEPLKLARGIVKTQAQGKWLTDSIQTDSPTLNTAYLRERYGNSLFLPVELTVPGTDSFQRAEAAPLELFLSAWESSNEAAGGNADLSSPSLLPSSSPSLYIAQCPLSRLPTDLAEAFPRPERILGPEPDTMRPRSDDKEDFSSSTDIYDSSLWLGAAPTATPLHRDPNPNLFVQVAGRKVIRLLPPHVGSELFAGVRREIAEEGGRNGNGSSVASSLGTDEKIRGEEMMKGKERLKLEEAVWRDPVSGDSEEEGRETVPDQGIQATLDEGEALMIPLGWWHAVRGVGQGINLSVNWWFRPRTGRDIRRCERDGSVCE